MAFIIIIPAIYCATNTCTLFHPLQVTRLTFDTRHRQYVTVRPTVLLVPYSVPGIYVITVHLQPHKPLLCH